MSTAAADNIADNVADNGARSRQAGQFLANGMLEDNYPRNMWWVAARADELSEKPLARWILELPLVLYRTSDGTPVALDDRYGVAQLLATRLTVTARAMPRSRRVFIVRPRRRRRGSAGSTRPGPGRGGRSGCSFPR